MTESTLARQIQDVIETRKCLCGPISKRLAKWNEFSVAIRGLVDALSPAGVNDDEKVSVVRDQLLDLKVDRVIEDRVRAWSIAKTRFSRPTINIGVGGQMKVGKSTLLQSISGLGKHAIPADNYECTAIRSRIFHDDNESHALIKFHTWESFSEAVLEPVYKALNQRCPATLGEFERQNIATLAVNNPVDNIVEHNKSNLNDIHRACWSYKELLSGGEKQVPLTDVHEFVAFPSQDALNSRNPGRKYLAVRSCEIRTKFPELEVSSLGLVDLPGVGSLNRDVDTQNIEGISNDVDVVLMLKRAIEEPGLAPVNEGDRRALDLFSSIARQGLGLDVPEDFVALVVNGSKPSDIENCERDLRHRLHTDKNTIYKLDVRKKDQARAQLLKPLLQHLAQKLPVMDDRFRAHLRKQDSDAIEELRQKLTGVLGEVTSSTIPVGMEERVVKWADSVIGNLAEKLNKLEAEYQQQADAETTPSQERFKKRIETLNGKLKSSWVKSHFDEKWLAEAAARIAIEKNDPIGEQRRSMLVCRAELRKQYKEIDDAFQEELKALRGRFTVALRAETRELLSDATDDLHAVELFRDVCSAAQCTALQEACEVVLAKHFSLKIHFMPAVAAGMRKLEPSESADAAKDSSVVEPLGADPKSIAKNVKHYLVVKCENAIEATTAAILEQLRLVDQVLYSIINHANDLFIRSQDIKTEYVRLVRNNIDKMWGAEMQALREKDALCRSRHAAVSAFNKAFADLASEVT